MTMTSKKAALPLRRYKVFVPDIKKTTITCCLDIPTINKIEKLSIDKIVMDFELEFNDVMYFAKGIYQDSFINKIKRMWTTPPERKFITFQVNKDTFNRLEGLKKFYGLTKSEILKYILKKHLCK